MRASESVPGKSSIINLIFNKFIVIENQFSLGVPRSGNVCDGGGAAEEATRPRFICSAKNRRKIKLIFRELAIVIRILITISRGPRALFKRKIVLYSARTGRAFLFN